MKLGKSFITAPESAHHCGGMKDFYSPLGVEFFEHLDASQLYCGGVHIAIGILESKKTV